MWLIILMPPLNHDKIMSLRSESQKGQILFLMEAYTNVLKEH